MFKLDKLLKFIYHVPREVITEREAKKSPCLYGHACLYWEILTDKSE